jgi:hypothetical protein
MRRFMSSLVLAGIAFAADVTIAQTVESTHAAHAQASMPGALGAYPMTRDASGTSWQPDSTPHEMAHTMHGDWMLSGHAMLYGVYDDQQGPRGGQREFIAGMVMGTARRAYTEGDTLTLKAMLSPDPFMGKRGYPLLLAAGETADGETPLVDRQHPHELIMELSAAWAMPLGEAMSAFVYAALPGEPAFGPPAFMHRSAAMASPEAPITHHWLDSTHITFGVLTAGFVRGAWKLEASQFTGREPDEDRFDIERPRMDSTAVRASWNPTPHWSLQASWADLESPEQLEPEVDESRVSASVTYTQALADDRWWSATLAWGRKNPTEGETTDALALEAAWAPARDWLVFARGESLETHDLGPTEAVFDVAKISFGALRDFRVRERFRIGLGALYSFNDVASALEPSYGAHPDGSMIFVRFVAGQ